LIRLAALAFCLSSALVSSPVQSAEGTSGKTIQAVRTNTPPKIDGVLDDVVWQKAAIVEDLHEVSPNEFSETSEPSKYYVLYDQNAIYVAVRLWESNLDDVTAKMLRKGDFSFGDDTITVLLDPHNDNRSGYLFDLNPNGVRNEGLYTDVTAENWAWQGIWNGAAEQDSEGWVAELEIPFKTLSFDPSNDTWGINFMRWRGQAGEWYGWVSGNGSVNPAYAGKLQGLAGLEQGLGLDIVPGLRISESKDFTTSLSSTDVEPSIDVFYKLTTALTAALTANTDFSGTGADARQINLSRFGLFFPERRNFFLQDTDIFEFGRIGATENYFNTTLSGVEKQSGRPFFSRRIGLSDSGEAVDLDIGGKMTGRVGRWDIGILDIQQASHSYLDESDQLVTVDSTNLFVGRGAARIFEESMLGVIVTNGDPTSNDDNTLIGVDFRYLNTRLESGRTIEGAMWYQQTDTTGLDGDDAAFGVSLKMPSAEGFRGGVSIKELQANYYPALGFVNRTDVRDYSAEFGHLWRPDSEAINGIYSGIDAQRIDTIAGELQSQVLTYRPFEIELASSDFLVFEYWHSKEQLVEDFPIHEDPTNGIINIPPGLYSFGNYCVRTGSGPHRVLAGQLWYCDGDFFDGDSVSVSAELTWRPSPHFKFSVLYDVNDIELPDGKFTTRLSSIRADIAFTNTWSWENFIQWDNVSNSLGVNSILRWLPRAGREMVFVINREFEDPNQTRNFNSTYSDIAFKFSYTFRY
jgi:Carbohydrate family 9 binding domain-like/Domain of unknown function (DUF5916)